MALIVLIKLARRDREVVTPQGIVTPNAAAPAG